MAEKHGETLFSEQVKAGSRTYFIDVQRASTGARYLKISESRLGEDGEHVHNRVMVFEENLPEFLEGLRKAWIELFFNQRRPRIGLGEVRKAHPRAYEKWTAEEDERLKVEFASGKKPPELAEILQRQRSAIVSRLKKLGLTE